jgi:hypothetical protein
MPAQEGLGLHDQQGLPPERDTAGQEHEERAVGRRTARPLDAAPQDEELLAQEGILGDELGLTARQIGQGVHEQDPAGGPGGRGQVLTEGVQEVTTETTGMRVDSGQHGGAPCGLRTDAPV